MDLPKLKEEEQKKRRKLVIPWKWIGLSLLLILLVAGGLAAWGWQRDFEPAIQSADLEPLEAHIGDDVRAVLLIKVPWQGDLRKDSGLDKVEGLDLADDPKVDAALSGIGTKTIRYSFIMHPYQLGEFKELKGKLIFHKLPKDQVKELEFELPALEVKGRLAEDADETLSLAGSYLRLDELEAVTSSFWIYVVIGIVMMTVFIGILIGLATWKQPEPPPPDPWITAENRIRALEEALPMKADPFFTQLSNTLRVYLEDAYQVKAAEQTTPEFLRSLDRGELDLTTEQRHMLRDFLANADLIKFAKDEASEEQMHDCLKDSRDFVKDTSEAVIRKRAEEEKARKKKVQEQPSAMEVSS